MELQKLNNNIPFKAYVLYTKRIVEMNGYTLKRCRVGGYDPRLNQVFLNYEKGEKDLLVILCEGLEDIYVELNEGRAERRNLMFEYVFSNLQELKERSDILN